MTPLTKITSFLILSFFITQDISAQLKDCQSTLSNDTLTIENNLIKRRMLWKNGGLVHIDLLNKSTGKIISGNNIAKYSDFAIPGLQVAPQNSSFKTYIVDETAATPTYLATEIITQYEKLICKRIFRTYPNCPAIACDIFLRGDATGWKNIFQTGMELKNIEDEKSRKAADSIFFVTDKITITGNHWKVKSVEFFDASDYNNTFIQEYNRLIYRQENRLRGNILLAQNTQQPESFFLLKEAPVSNIQLYYQGTDFTTRFGEVKTIGAGIAPQDISDTNWVRGYSIVVGVGNGNTEQALLSGLRSYQSLQRKMLPVRDEMIMSNTWGDRNRDSRVNETFVLKEIEAAAKMGITHVQIDDGWQLGISSNSANKTGSLTNIWSNPDYWKVNPKKFPNGLEKIIQFAKEKNIIISLWFNPSTDSSFANWEKDANAVIGLYKQYGIITWKIDGVNIPDKTAEINFKKFLDKVTTATNYQAVFNLDVTAGKRFGYHSFTQYGSLYLENRYTDWTNYYPYTTLRNLWQLSKYVAPQRFQIEFLNKWRNVAKYPNEDSLAPSYYSFNYLFAIAMVAQPLAFMEVSELPKEALPLNDLIKQYKTINTSLHNAQIFPIGQEPNGYGWTGFQAIQKNMGYFLIFRESNPLANQMLNTWLPPGSKLQITPVLGKGNSYTAIVDKDQKIQFHLETKNSFVLLKYKIIF